MAALSHLGSSRASRPRSYVGHLAATSALFAACVSAADTVSVTPPSTTASASPLSNTLAPYYVGMGIEPTNLFAFSGGETRNELSYNLLANLKDYTGVPPFLRIGGNSGDTILYNSSATGFEIFTNPSPTGNGSTGLSDQYYVGPDFFTAIDNFPAGTPISYGLNLAWQGDGWLQSIQDQAAAALNTLKNVTVFSFEIGNEPDLYIDNGYRSSGYWGVSEFAAQWQTIVLAVYDNVLESLGYGTNYFEPACTATTATTTGQPYRISALADSAIALDDGIYVGGWNQHDYYYYVDVSDYTITSEDLLELPTTRSQLAEWDSQSSQAAETGKKYYLREYNSIGPTGISGISDTFTQALWTINAFLYAATQGMDSVQMHMTTLSFNNPWSPVTATSSGITAGVRPAYYAFAAMDQIIGATCNVQVASQTLSGTPSAYSNFLGSYTAYTAGDLQTLVALNTMPLTSGGTGNTVDFVYSIPSWAGQTVYVSLLTASGSDATENATWNGISYESSGDGTPTSVSSAAATSMTVGSSGSLTVGVRDSQVAVINMGSVIGSSNAEVNDTNCAAFSFTKSSSSSSSGTSSSSSSLPTFSSSSSGSGTDGGYNPYSAGVLAAFAPHLFLTILLGVTIGALAAFA